MRMPSRMPGRLSVRGGSPTFSGGPASYDYAIGGLPWLSAASPSAGNNFYYGDRRIKRATAQVRKQQFDNQQSPGEQSLDGFWIRSQMSFHGGAGQVYSDPGRDTPFSDIRFDRSKNVDPWTRGQLSLLNGTTPAVTSGGPKPDTLEMFSIITTDGTGCVVQLRASDLIFLNVSGASSVKTNPSAGTMLSITSDGNAIFVAATDGIWKAAIPATPATALSWSKIYAYTSAVHQELAWVKERLVLGNGAALYELSPSPAGAPVALPVTPIYTAKPSGWTWTSISETSPAIYAVGSAGSVSSILKFTLNTSGALPVLTGGTVAATLPGGETAISVFGYLGNFMGIGTSRGARVAESDTEGFLTYGPLLFETTDPVTDWTGRDRFLWCTYSESDTEIKLARIDLSLQIEALRFAYATDLCVTGDGLPATSVAFYGGTDQLAFATATDGYRETEDTRAVAGNLYTSRIRFSTLEPKNFRSFRLRGPELDGALGVSVVDNTGVETPVVNFGVGQTPGLSDVTMPTGLLQDFIQLKFSLNSSGTPGDVGAILYGWQVKALPGSPRQRLITLPLLCFDSETDAKGQRTGIQGSALSRLLALEAVESQGGVTTFQDITGDVTYDVFIEGMEFDQVDPPPGWKGWGGIIMIELRTV